MQAVIAGLAAAFLAFAALPADAAPHFRHIVIIVQENRTPDNLFGSNPHFEPGVDLATTGTTSQGQTVALTPEPLVSCYDIEHTHQAFEDALTRGFDTERVSRKGCTNGLPANPQFKFVDNSTGILDPYFAIARANGFGNRMFQTNQGPSFPAHQFLFGGTSAPDTGSRLFASENPPKNDAGCLASPRTTIDVINADGSQRAEAPVYPCFERQTLGDLLDSARLGWRYYATNPSSIWTAPDAIGHICQAQTVKGTRSCTGTIWSKSVVPDNPAQVLTDIADCNLASVSWVTPSAAESDHALINKGLGPQWVASIVNAVGGQSCPSGETYWTDTAIFIVWDDWGGWYDHVQPVEINISRPEWGAGYTYGFRVPLLVVSAYTPAGYVDNHNFDFGSLLAFTEENFGLGFIRPGVGTYGRYADYHATRAPFGALDSFFTLVLPKPFAPIPTTMTARDFIRLPKSAAPPDDD